MKLQKTRELQILSHQLIPGGCHTYAKGDDQFPELAPGFIQRGLGCHVWDVDGNAYIEYGMGLRAVALGHAYPPVVEAVQKELRNGTNFTRPSPIEVQCAQHFLRCIEGADQVKFTKDGSTATSAAVKLARAHTGRDRVAICRDFGSFYSYDDWFIGTTPMRSGIPDAIANLTVTFSFNDLESVRQLFADNRDQIACLVMQPARNEEPRDDFLNKTLEICHQHGAILVLDENITGFRWHVGGAQKYYDVVPDLSVFGKAMANGFALSALAGKRELMDLGGIHHEHERVFLLSTTHGAETHSMAAAIATMEVYQREPVIEQLHRRGRRLAEGFRQMAVAHGLDKLVGTAGKECNLVYYALDQDRNPSQALRSLILQETIRRGIIMPSLVVSYSHSDQDIDKTIDALDGAFHVYRRALDDGVEKHLVGKPSKVVFRQHN